MNNYFLLSWNDEYLDMRIVSGPFHDSGKSIAIKAEVVRQLQSYLNKTSNEAELIYESKLADESDFPEIDLNIYTEGASFRYNGDNEERLQVVQYDF